MEEIFYESLKISEWKTKKIQSIYDSKLDEMIIDTHIIIGNHDTYYKNTNEVNALQNLNISKNAKIYTRADTVNIGGLDILFLPWICDDNLDFYKLVLQQYHEVVLTKLYDNYQLLIFSLKFLYGKSAYHHRKQLI